MSQPALRVVGGGPAGSAAALAALGEGRAVELFEKSVLPRHKVCGEFISPEAGAVLERLGVFSAFLTAGPARIGRIALHFGRKVKRARLAEPAFGLSRYALDAILMEEAALRGARVRREAAVPAAGCVLATGRSAAGARGNRLFGFKAHFTGPADDAVELFFFNGCYAGVSAVENGKTNVCALAAESMLRACGFDFDAVLRLYEALAERVAPLARATRWIATGPVMLGGRFDPAGETLYRAGDALGFIDPFTGSGILSALMTGRLAGLAAARGTPPGDHLRECRRRLARQYEVAGLFRAALRAGWADYLAWLIPGRLLFQLTRPRLTSAT
ncbi:MAG TPA: hypothetical protein PLA43_04845 [Bryobacteraceae bacterium]|nr:hypothetical protein [Bryobacteraceae bacterium]HOQ45189.1 hypothetical protein [Bryobacteraceae bacterium]HPQ15611.1 hypothetical protein [Bryobacteraceae bacterium]HPU71261.1 hypothetical protein [Bryobacteraceae bacterium]